MILLSNGGSHSQRAPAPSDTIIVGTVDGIAVLKRMPGGWEIAHRALAGCSVTAVTADEDGTLYAATHGIGVARSVDGGITWTWCNTGLAHFDLWSARAGRLQGRPVVLVGSLPAHLYISEDAGNSWRELTAMRDVASRPEWVFPPPPRVGHVKDIVIDGERLLVGIEIGALLVSTDFGRTFRDLRIDPVVGECDVHRILTHAAAPRRITVANGLVGLLTSDDDGATWRKHPMPAEADYPDPIVVHPDDPDLMFLTAGVGWPQHWYKIGRARGKIFRSRDAGQTWDRLLGGLPDGQRALFGALTIEACPDGFGLYAADSDGQIFESLDGGDRWRVIADTAPVAKGEFHRGLVRDRVKLATTDDIVIKSPAGARLAATKV